MRRRGALKGRTFPPSKLPRNHTSTEASAALLTKVAQAEPGRASDVLRRQLQCGSFDPLQGMLPLATHLDSFLVETIHWRESSLELGVSDGCTLSGPRWTACG